MNYDYKHMSIVDFLDELKSGKPTPGGGGVASLNSAQGAALLIMVANRTIGRKQYHDVENLNIKARDECEVLLHELICGIDRDAIVFSKASEAYAMKKDDPEARIVAIAEALVDATKASLEVMSNSVKVLEIADRMLGHSNKNLESNIYVAALCLQAGLLAARYNVFVILPSIRKKDKALACKMQLLAERLTKKGLELSDDIIDIFEGYEM